MLRRRSHRLLVACLSVVAACSSPAGQSPGTPGSSSGTKLTVFAAASLTESFTEIAERFEADHPGTTVTLNFASSSSLAAQINEGAPADVFASADSENMDRAHLNRTNRDARSEGVPEPQFFASNRLQIIVEPDNPKAIVSIADLARSDVVVVAAGTEVPIGRYAAQVLAQANVVLNPRSYEANVKGIVTKVVLGEADAGIVYATDVVAAGDKAAGVPIPDDINVVAEYPISITDAAHDVALAKSFISFVLGPSGQAVLRNAGFAAP